MRYALLTRGLTLVLTVCALPLVVCAQQEDAETPEMLLQTAHSAWVGAIEYSPDGAHIASAGYDGTLKVWEAETQRLLWVERPDFRGFAVAISPDGRFVVTQDRIDLDSATSPGEACLQLRDLLTDEALRQYPRPTGEVLSLAFSPDGRFLAAGTGCADGLHRLPEALRQTFSPDVLIWDVASCELLATLKGHTDSVWALRFSPDSELLASADGAGAVKLWRVPTGEEIAHTMWRDETNSYTGNLSYGPRGLAFSADLSVFAAWRPGAGVVVLDPRSGELLNEFSPVGRSGTLAISDDGTRLATVGSIGSGTVSHVTILDTGTGQTLREFSHPDRVWSIRFRPDMDEVVTGHHGGAIRMWDARPAEETVAMLPRVVSAQAVCFSPKDGLLATADDAGAVMVWDMEGAEPLWSSLGRSQSGAINCLAFSPDGSELASGSIDGTLGIWDVQTGRLVHELTVETGWRRWAGIITVTYSPDGSLIAVGSPGIVRVWRADSPGEDELVLEGHPWRRASIAISPDGSLLATSDLDYDILVYELTAGELVARLEKHTHWITSLLFAGDGKHLLSGAVSMGVEAKRPRREGQDPVYVWDVENCKVVREFDNGKPCVELRLSEDEQRLTVVDYEGGVAVLDMATGEVLCETEGTVYRSQGSAISPDAGRFAISSADGVAIYDGSDGRMLANLMTVHGDDPDRLEWLITTPEGYFAGSAEATKLVTWRVGGEIFPMEAFRDAFNRPDLVARALRGESLADERTMTTEDLPPGIMVLTPENMSAVEGDSVAVDLVAHGCREIADIEIRANGRRVSADTEKGILLTARGIMITARDPPARHRVTEGLTGIVPLPPGETRVTLQFIAVDSGGLRSKPVEVTVLRRDAEQVQGVLHLLAVGISDYEDARYGLGYAALDALTIAEAIEGQAGPERLYAGVKATALVNSAATADGIRTALASMADDARPEDTVVLFLSGHGLRDDRHRYYFASYELDLTHLGPTSLPWNELQALVREMAAKQVLVLLDTCHAGAALGQYAASNQSLGEALASRAGVMVLASSAAGERSFESDEWEHGAFTAALIEALSGRCGTRLSPGVLEDYVGSRVAELTAGRQHPYVPIRTQFPAGTPLLLAMSE